jgi:hypothetical protein
VWQLTWGPRLRISLIGPSLPLRNVRRLVAIEGEADIAWKSSAVWVWTRSGPLSMDLLSRNVPLIMSRSEVSRPRDYILEQTLSCKMFVLRYTAIFPIPNASKALSGFSHGLSGPERCLL